MKQTYLNKDKCKCYLCLHLRCSKNGKLRVHLDYKNKSYVSRLVISNNVVCANSKAYAQSDQSFCESFEYFLMLSY